jgi:hypothetical protein
LAQAVHTTHRFPVGDSCQDGARPIHGFQARAKIFQRPADDVQAEPRLRSRVTDSDSFSIGIKWCRSRHSDQIADANGPRDSNDRFVWRASRNVLTIIAHSSSLPNQSSNQIHFQLTFRAPLRLAGFVRVIAALAFEVSLDLVGRNRSVFVHRARVILGARTRKLATEKFDPEVRTMRLLAHFGRLTAKGNLQATTSAVLFTIFP